MHYIEKSNDDSGFVVWNVLSPSHLIVKSFYNFYLANQFCMACTKKEGI